MKKTHDYKVFKCFSRKFKIGGVEPPPYVKLIFAKYSGGGAHIEAAKLRRFMAEVQGEEGSTLADAERIMEDVGRRRQNQSESTEHHPPSLTLDDFFHYLLSDLNQAIKTQVHHDMTAPLPHYFIYTGHNSYLTGNQLSSECSDVPIIKALQAGVRVIELDIWPNSTKDDIQVFHGRTLTTPVTLIKCLRSIREYAFVTSPYPLIITLEDHLTPDLQAKVAEMVSVTFKDMLYYPQSGRLEKFPSPESLKHRIIISTKAPKEEDVESKNIKGKENCSQKEGDEGENSPREEVRHLLAELEDEETDNENNEYEENSGSNGRPGQSETCPDYKLLITIHAGKPKGGLKSALSIGSNQIRRLSLSEQALEKAAASHGADLVRFTQKNVLRIYPKGTRVNSSNYEPMLGWTHGAQMVAFNMQGHGKSLWLMQGMFRCNGGCGYIKKPQFLMTKGPHREVFDPNRTLPVKTTLKVGVHMGDGWSSDFSPRHFDSYSPPDFYLKLHMVGVPADDAKRKTKIIDDNWFPVWDESFVFSLTVPELALLRIEVREHDRSEKDDFGGQTCLPVSELRPGIRSVPLFGKKGEKYKSVRLLMQFEFL